MKGQKEKRNGEGSPSVFPGFPFWLLPKPTSYRPNLFSPIVVPHVRQPMKIAEIIK